ncbi:MAG: hypothetical protein IKP83_00070 [Bacteroidales bacterium]|nr:hypothetical protein [Bacteroidales bacterium]
MKKIVLAIAVIALAAGFVSCNKKCTCKTYANGVVISTQEDVEVDGKCADMNNIVIANPKTGVECE